MHHYNKHPFANNYYSHMPMCMCRHMYQPVYWNENSYVPYANQYLEQDIHHSAERKLSDHGKTPYVVNINRAAKGNQTFRRAIWTGEYFQVTLMSIDVGDDVGLEVHPDVDQFIRIEEGQGIVQMGEEKDQLDFEKNVYDDSAIMIPAGTWHNLTNTGHFPLKLYSIYAPPEHPFGTIHKTKAEAMYAEE